MRIQRKLLLLVLVLLLISVGIVAAQTSTNFISQRFVLLSGGSADSANYKVTAVIGQPATGVASGGSHMVSTGFLYPPAGFHHHVLLPVLIR